MSEKIVTWSFSEDVSICSDPIGAMKYVCMYATFEEEYHSDSMRADAAWAKSLEYFLEWIKRG